MEVTKRVQSFPPAARRLITGIFGGTFMVLVFVVLPQAADDLGAELGWHRSALPAGRLLGGALFFGSVGLVLHCSRVFARVGKGTPVPIDPPSQLVDSGIYRCSRNPIYVGQVGVLFSYFLYSGALALLLYAFAWALLVHGFIVWVEEPALRRRFGPFYDDYCREVPRWLGRPAA